MFKLIVAGSRTFNQYPILKKKLDFFLMHRLPKVEIVSGKARGADRLGEEYAKERNLILKEFPADWNMYGKQAGLIRNAQMANYAHGLVAFWDGTSSGTQDMICKMKAQKKPIRIVRFTLPGLSSEA
ncbi:DUF2493 domain-containing protein [Simkania sp.]|uniref:DUF2493 domain-containing protein n=1 Tax=Simkania sp. TaxID=34094 RepID=UPI003B51DDA5